MARVTVDTEDLVSVHDIALLFGIGLSAVSNWQKRDIGFPGPVLAVANGSTKLWSLRAVLRWYMTRDGEEQINAHLERVKKLVALMEELKQEEQ